MSSSCGNDGCRLQGRWLSAWQAESLERCPACGANLRQVGAPPSAWPVEEFRAPLATAPYPVAVLLRALADAREPEAVASLVVQLLGATLRTHALIVASEYIQSRIRSEALTQSLERDLAINPALTAWPRFLRRAAEILEREGHEWFAPGLIAGFREFAGPGGADEALGGSLGLLLEWRNRLMHGALPGRESLEAELRVLWPDIAQLVRSLTWFEGVQMLQREGTVVWSLAGPRPRVLARAWPGGDASVCIVRADGMALGVHPWLLAGGEQLGENAIGELLTFDQWTGRQLQFVGAQGGRYRLLRPLRDWADAVASKRRLLQLAPQSLTPEALQERCRAWTARTLADLIHARKVLPGTHQPRQEVERHLRGFAESSTRLAVLAAAAGAGKTNVLASLVRSWEAEGRWVLFVRGEALASQDLLALLRAGLGLSEEVRARELAACCRAGEAALLLVIDGLNEAPERADLLASLAALLRETTRGDAGPPALRALVSWRSEDVSWTRKVLGNFERDDCYPSLERLESRDGTRAASGLEATLLGALGPAEVDALWKRLGRSDKGRFRPRFTPEDLRRHSPVSARALGHPLTLRTWLEVYSGHGLPVEASSQRLAVDWFDWLGRRSGDGGSLLADLARLLMAARTRRLSLQALFDDASLSEQLLRRDPRAPFRVLTEGLGLLVVTRVEGDAELVFTMDRWMEQVCGLVMAADIVEPNAACLIERLQSWAGWDAAAGIVGAALGAFVDRAGLLTLAEFVDLADGLTGSLRQEALEGAGRQMARSVLGGAGPEEVAAAVLEELTDADLEALGTCVEALGDEVAWESAERLLVRALDLESAQVPAARSVLLVRLAQVRHELGDQAGRIEALEAVEALPIDPGELVDVTDEARTGLALSYAALRSPKAIPAAEELVERALSRGGRESDDWRRAAEVFARVLFELDSQERAFALQMEVVAQEELVEEPDVGRLATALGRAATYAQARGSLAEALRLRKRAHALWVEAEGERGPAVAYSLGSIAWTLEDMGRSEAVAYRQRSLEISQELYGSRHPLVAAALENLGRALLETRGGDAALETLAAALDAHRDVFGAEHPSSLNALSRLAWAHQDARQDEVAIRLRREAVEGWLRAAGEVHPEVAKAMHALASTLTDSGEHDEALAWHERALAAMRKIHASDHSDLAESIANVGIVHFYAGRASDARPWLIESQQMLERIHGPTHPEVRVALLRTAVIERESGDPRAAIACYERALGQMRGVLHPGHPHVLAALRGLVPLVRSLDPPEDAIALQRELVAACKAVDSPDPEAVSDQQAVLARLLRDVGSFAEAEQLLLTVLVEREGRLGRNAAQVRLTRVRLAELALARDEPARALQELEALRSMPKLADEAPSEVAHSIPVLMAEVLLALGQSAKARAALDEARAFQASGQVDLLRRLDAVEAALEGQS